jgi:hypothetical protein
VVDLTRPDDAVPAKKTKPNPLKEAWLKVAAPPPEAATKLLESLASGQPSELERARAVKVVEIKASTVQPAAAAAHATASKTMAATRLSEPEFQGKGLVLNVSNRAELWCKPCRRSVKTKKSIVAQHVSCDTHVAKLAIWLERAKARRRRLIR